jgi:uncharacterized protein YjgD (DUF1641 family)
MTSKLHELKETTTDAINIVKELRDPEVQKSLENIKAISNTVNDIVAVFKDPQFAKNVENINLAANYLRESMVAMQNTAAELNNAGTLDEVNKTIKSVRIIIDSFSEVQTKGGMIVSITNLLVSLKQLIEETQKARRTLPKKEDIPAPLIESE